MQGFPGQAAPRITCSPSNAKHTRTRTRAVYFVLWSKFPSIIHALVFCWLPGRDDRPTKCPGQRAADTMYAALVLPLPDCFTISLHGPNDRHWPAVWAVSADCLETVTVTFEKPWEFPLVTSSQNALQLWHPQSTFIPANHTGLMLANWKSCFDSPLTVLQSAGYDCLTVYNCPGSICRTRWSVGSARWRSSEQVSCVLPEKINRFFTNPSSIVTGHGAERDTV